MKEAFHTLSTAQGAMEVFQVEPDGHGPHAAVVVAMEAFGVNHHIQNVCRHLAEAGYAAVAPDLYHRSGKLLTYGYEDVKSALAELGKLTNDGLQGDMDAALSHARQLKGVRHEGVGVVGFCVGGFASFLTAARLDPAAAVAFYGAGIVHGRDGVGIHPVIDEASHINCPVLMFFGAQDGSIPADDVKTIDQRLTSAGKRHEIKVYHDAGHGFFCDERASYRPIDAGDAWKRTLAWFASNLRKG